MNLTQYVPLALRTENPLSLLRRFSHGCMGLITESGEIVTELKRMEIYEKPLDAERKKHILEEIGDVMWYVAILLDAIEMDLEMMEDASKPDLANMPKDDEGLYEASALMLGDHVGRVCREVQLIFVLKEMNEEGANRIVTSLAMIISCMTILAERCDSTLELALNDNIAKLQVRFPSAYSNENAEGRADKDGLDARNS